MDLTPWRLTSDRVGIWLSLVLLGVPAFALWLTNAFLAPALVRRGLEPLSAWFSGWYARHWTQGGSRAVRGGHL
jgi:hypothetical protein